MSDDKDLKHDKHPHPNPSPSKGEGHKDEIPLVPPEQRLQSKTFETKGEALQQKSSGAEDEEPYPGLRPYREDEKGKFFGRDTDTEILIDKVLTNRLTLLFAASGVGKSSLLQAAVIPHLKSKTGENLAVVYHIDWVSDPVRSVGDAVLAGLRSAELLPDDVGDEERGETLADLLGFCGLFVRPPLVLILDQFEEFFRYQRHQEGFQQFIDQLTAVVTNKSLPVSVVISMREDFALELNAFKPKLPTILFENFYRLEKLGRRAVRDAVVTPVEQRGFAYEPELLDQLLTDLLSRELDRQPNSPVVEMLETVEPPYLQIVCARLWDLNKDDAEQTLRLVSYEKVGRAQGILKNYLDGVLYQFSAGEKKLASMAFDHFVVHRGAKMAYTAGALADILQVDSELLIIVLEKLERVRILRKQQDSSVWFELYHDMFSIPIERWNNTWKNKMRTQRVVKMSLGILSGFFVIFAGWGSYINLKNYNFHLSPRQSSMKVELWRGMPGSFDLFGFKNYLAQTKISRSQIEPDKRFFQQLVIDYSRMQNQLIGYEPIEKRVLSYAENGNFKKSTGLVESYINSKNTTLVEKMLPELARVNTLSAARLVMRALLERPRDKKVDFSRILNGYSENIRPKIINSDLISPRLGIMISHEDFNKKKSKGWVFGNEVLAYQISTKKAFDELYFLLKTENESNAINAMMNYPIPSETISVLMDLLGNGFLDVKLSSIDALGKLSVKAAVPEIIKLLDDSDRDIRVEAVKALGEITSPEAIPGLISSLDDEAKSVRRAAVLALGKFNEKSAILSLINALKEEERFGDLESLIITTLGNIESEESALFLLNYIGDEKKQVRSAVISAVVSSKAVEAVNGLLEIAISDNDVEIRRDAIRALGELYDAQAFEALLVLQKRKEKLIEDVVIEALGGLCFTKNEEDFSEVMLKYSLAKKDCENTEIYKKVFNLLLMNLMHGDSDNKIATIRSLGKLGGEKSIPGLLLEFKKGNAEIRKEILKAVSHVSVQGQDNKDNILRDLLPSLKDDDGEIRHAVLKVFSRLNLKSAPLKILAMTEDEDEDVDIRVSAIEFLAGESESLIFPILSRTIKDKEPAVRIATIKALGKLKASDIVPYLLLSLEDSDWGVKNSAAEALKTIQFSKKTNQLLIDLKNENQYIQEGTIEAIKKLKEKKAYPALLLKIKDPNPKIRKVAIKALGSLNMAESIPIIMQALNDEDSSVKISASEVLGDLHSIGAVPELNYMLNSPDKNVSKAASLALTKINANENIPKIIDFLGKDRVVGEAAANSIVAMNRDYLIPYLFNIFDNYLEDYEYEGGLSGVFANLLSRLVNEDVREVGSSGFSVSAQLGSGELLSLLIRRLLSGESKIRYSAIEAALLMKKSGRLNNLEKSLIKKALSKVSNNELILISNYLKKKNNEQVEKQLEFRSQPMNIPGIEGKSLTVYELKQKLEDMNQAYINWRVRRDAKALKANDSDSLAAETQIDLSDPAPFIYEYAYAIAHESEKDGIELLGHNLYKVREAAARGLANSDALGVELLKKLEKAWLETDDPIERQGIYHAIDIALLAIEGVGYEKELADLKAYEPTLTNERSAASIKPRVEWTRIQLQWRVDANKELEELAARQLPKLLKEYCLNEDGTDIPEEECTIGN